VREAKATVVELSMKRETSNQ